MPQMHMPYWLPRLIVTWICLLTSLVPSMLKNAETCMPGLVGVVGVESGKYLWKWY
uniref:ATPase subunit 8 n=1 Tax=Tetrabrachium ocellatum TaxID=242972 RepID=D3KRD6_TETOC|nr:ATPase subunit 8 [Tetrabrachium ocellatum]